MNLECDLPVSKIWVFKFDVLYRYAEALRLAKRDAQELAIVRVKLADAVEELEHLRERGGKGWTFSTTFFCRQNTN